jgi:hypothetical protein
MEEFLTSIENHKEVVFWLCVFLILLADSLNSKE